MRRNSLWVRSSVFLLVILVGCGKKEPAAESGAPLAATAVQTAPVVLQSMWDEEEVVGGVEAAQRAVLSAKVTGVIDGIKTAPGAIVSQGEVLLTIDAREIKARLDQAEAAKEQAEKDFARVQKLLQSGSSTRQEFDAATTRLRTAEAGLVEARTMMQYTSIVSPFDGVVTRKLVEVGDLATPGKPLLGVENSSLLRFECEIPEALVDRIQMGSELPVRVDAAGTMLTGKVSEIAPSASAGSRTFLVKLDLPEAEKLRAGQFGRVRVPVKERPVVVVPLGALVRRGQVESVFVVQDKRARLRLVKTGRSIDGKIEILSGLSGDELVVTSDPSLLIDGTAVEAGQ